MKQLLFLTTLVLGLSSCLQSPMPIPVDARKQVQQGHGSVLLEVIHAIGPQGPRFDEWTEVRVVPVDSDKKASEIAPYSLEPVLSFGRDSAVFAGTLPSGFYRLVAFRGKRHAGIQSVDYVSHVPAEVGEFFVSPGRLNSLGVMVESSVGLHNWIYRREPDFNLRDRVRELRPDLTGLDLPLSEPESLRDHEEPDFSIDRAYPTTSPVLIGESRVLLGAQFGHIYYRTPPDPDAMSVAWDVFKLDTLQSVIDVLPVDDRYFIALVGDGRSFRVDTQSGKASRLEIDVPGRVVGLGMVNDTLLAVATRFVEQGEDASMRIHADVYRKGVVEWQRIASISDDREPTSIVSTDDELLLTFDESQRPRFPADARLVRVDVASGETDDDHEAPGPILRHLDGEVLVAASGTWRQPDDIEWTENNGRIWRGAPRIVESGWPTLNGEGEVILIGSNKLEQVMRPQPRVLTRTEAPEFWKGSNYYPVTCHAFIEMIYVEGKPVTLCGERVFSLQSHEYGWRKEALHELQSTLQ